MTHRHPYRNVKTGLPSALGSEELLEAVDISENLIAEELGHRRKCTDPGASTVQAITDADLSALRLKFPFLREFSDSFIRSTKPDCILRMESTTLKIKESERARDADDKLAANRAELGLNVKNIPAGSDDRWSILHEGRFLPGAGCSTTKIWLKAREVLGTTGAPPIGNYDMNTVGLGGFVSARGWVELANPSSTKLSLKMFSLNSCNSKVTSKKHEEVDSTPEFSEVGEFQLALRTLRTAAGFVSPWNFSFVALENFLINNKFCKDDLQGLDKQAVLLTQFVDYVIVENAARWRDAEPFLSSGDLKNTWQAFFSARPQSSLVAKKSDSSNQAKNKNFNQQSRQQNQFKKPNTLHKLPFIEVCYRWNINRCSAPTGQCTTYSGIPLKHVCDQRTDPNNLAVFCGQSHRRIDNH